MSEYLILLEEARSKVLSVNKTKKTIAKDCIPKLYDAYSDENPNLNPLEVRERIEEDCKNLWSKRTILEVLPDEAKNLEKQKAGKQRNKNKSLNSAAMTAAPTIEEKVVIDTFGNIVSDNEASHLESDNNFTTNNRHKENLAENHDNNLNEQLLDFEFCLKFKDLRQHMTSLFNTNGDNGDVWFHGIIDTNSGQVVEANTGRNSQVGE
jgi:hypothetical protein